MPTTENQTTQGKAESIDTVDFRALLADVVEHYYYPKGKEVTNALITRIEAWGEQQHAIGLVEGQMLARKDVAHYHAVAQKAKDGLANWERIIETAMALDYANRAMKAEAELKAIAERQADRLSKLQRYIQSPMLNIRAETEGPLVFFSDVQAILSPAQQEPAKFPPLEFSHDVLGNKVAASATDAGQDERSAMLAQMEKDSAFIDEAHHGITNGISMPDKYRERATPAQATPDGGHPSVTKLWKKWMVKEGFIENQLDSDTGFDSSIQQMRQCYLDAYAAGAASLQRANHAISDELATYKAMIDLYGTQQLEDAIAAALEANQQAKKP